MENTNQNKQKDLKEQIKKLRLSNYIMEEENSLLRENLDCALNENEIIKNENEIIKNENKQVMKTREEIDKIMSGKIYKILKRIKKIIK